MGISKKKEEITTLTPILATLSMWHNGAQQMFQTETSSDFMEVLPSDFMEGDKLGEGMEAVYRPPPHTLPCASLPSGSS